MVKCLVFDTFSFIGHTASQTLHCNVNSDVRKGKVTSENETDDCAESDDWTRLDKLAGSDVWTGSDDWTGLDKLAGSDVWTGSDD